MPTFRIPRNITTRKAEKRFDPRKGMDGLFAREAIRSGEIVWVSVLRPEDCAFYTWEQIQKDPILTRYSYQIGADLFSVSKDVESDVSNFFNHSCDPNTWYDDSVATRARMFLEYGAREWSDDPASPFRGGFSEIEKRFAEYAAGRPPKKGDSPLFDRALELFEETLAKDDRIEYIVARRDIAKDEEVTMDYATFWVVNDLEFECHCGAKACRKHLKAADYRLQNPHHVSSFVRTLFR